MIVLRIGKETVELCSSCFRGCHVPRAGARTHPQASRTSPSCHVHVNSFDQPTLRFLSQLICSLPPCIRRRPGVLVQPPAPPSTTSISISTYTATNHEHLLVVCGWRGTRRVPNHTPPCHSHTHHYEQQKGSSILMNGSCRIHIALASRSFGQNGNSRTQSASG